MKYDITSLKRKMLVKYPFFGNVIANTEYREDETIPTAETDGEAIYYNPFFLESLEPLEQVFVLAHEVCHIAFNHILRSFDKDSDTWNIATDAVINCLLKRDGLKIIPGAIDMPEAINYDAEEFYEILLKKQNKQKSGQDNHKKWGKGKSNPDNKKSIDSERNFEEKDLNETINNQDELNEFQEMGEQEAFDKNREEKKRQLEEFKEEIKNKSNNCGNGTNSITRNTNDIGIAKPLIDWRYILRDTTNFDVDYSYRNATIEDGVITSHLEEIPTPEVEIVLDTSGSINEDLLKSFLKECKNILTCSRLKIGCFDTKFYGFKEINQVEDIDNMKFVGGGGTDFNVAVHAFTRRVENKIIFTDGEAETPKMSLDVIWIVFGNKEINPKGGKVFYIDEEMLTKAENKIKRLIKK